MLGPGGAILGQSWAYVGALLAYVGATLGPGKAQVGLCRATLVLSSQNYLFNKKGCLGGSDMFQVTVAFSGPRCPLAGSMAAYLGTK